MQSKKSLQTFTEIETKIYNLLSLEQVTPNDVKPLSEPERTRLMEVLTEKFNTLNGVERDAFCNKVEPITNHVTKNQLWEGNHIKIMWAISTLIQENGRMPVNTTQTDPLPPFQIDPLSILFQN